MRLTPQQIEAIDNLNLGGHPAHAPYIDWDLASDDEVRIDGTLKLTEMRALMAIWDKHCGADQLDVGAMEYQGNTVAFIYEKRVAYGRMIDEARRMLVTASHALRSYQYGNGSGDLAGEVANKIDTFIGGGS